MGTPGRSTGAHVCLYQPKGHPTSPSVTIPGAPSDDVRGHLIAARFNGSNTDLRNFAPIGEPTNQAMNHGVEADVRRRIKNNERIFYLAYPIYQGPRSRFVKEIHVYWASSTGEGKVEVYSKAY